MTRQRVSTAGALIEWLATNVSVYRASGQVARLGVGETLSGEEVLPDFTCPVVEVFPRHASV